MILINPAYKLLLLSNSTKLGEEFLTWPEDHIRKIFSDAKGDLVFIPFAGVTITWNDYTARVNKRMNMLGLSVKSVHTAQDPKALIKSSAGIIIGGGNTFHLTHFLYKYDLIESIKLQISNSVPYLGWSAGTNVACPTMQTTNDMPILPLQNYHTFGFVPFQINAHYTDKTIPNHGGETRADRLNEYLSTNSGRTIIGLREQTGLIVKDGNIELIGEKPAEIFRNDKNQHQILPGPFVI